MCMSVHHLCAYFHGGQNRVSDSLCELCCGCWGLNMGLLKEKPLRFSTEPPLHPQHFSQIWQRTWNNWFFRRSSSRREGAGRQLAREGQYRQARNNAIIASSEVILKSFHIHIHTSKADISRMIILAKQTEKYKYEVPTDFAIQAQSKLCPTKFYIKNWHIKNNDRKTLAVNIYNTIMLNGSAFFKLFQKIHYCCVCA